MLSSSYKYRPGLVIVARSDEDGFTPPQEVTSSMPLHTSMTSTMDLRLMVYNSASSICCIDFMVIAECFQSPALKTSINSPLLVSRDPFYLEFALSTIYRNCWTIQSGQ